MCAPWEEGSLTANCLSEERREGTLGLLFLTPLSVLDILLGKLVSSALAAVYWILGILSVLSLTLLMGGVAFGEFFRLSITLLNTLFPSLAARLFVSSLTEDACKAITNGIALAFSWQCCFLRCCLLWNEWTRHG